MLCMNEHYQQTPEELYQKLDACPEGLSAETAAKHLEQYGKNAIAEAKKTPTWLIFLEQFKDFLVIILIIAALISAFTGDLESFIVIIAVITMNAILGTVQTVKAEKSLSNLKKLSSPTAKVLRDGQTVVLPAEEVTVGDLVLLEAGDQIPADGRLVDCASLQTTRAHSPAKAPTWRKRRTASPEKCRWQSGRTWFIPAVLSPTAEVSVL